MSKLTRKEKLWMIWLLERYEKHESLTHAQRNFLAGMKASILEDMLHERDHNSDNIPF
jgi:hypothetical protein